MDPAAPPYNGTESPARPVTSSLNIPCFCSGQAKGGHWLPPPTQTEKTRPCTPPLASLSTRVHLRSHCHLHPRDGIRSRRSPELRRVSALGVLLGYTGPSAGEKQLKLAQSQPNKSLTMERLESSTRREWRWFLAAPSVNTWLMLHSPSISAITKALTHSQPQTTLTTPLPLVETSSILEETHLDIVQGGGMST